MLLSKSLANIKVMTEEEFKRIIEEYNFLFIGPGHLKAPPWESVYISKEKIIFDEHTLSVREFYKNWGVNTNIKNKEPDDHIGFQLEFMSILSGKAINSIEKNNMIKLEKIIKAQINFLDSHTLLWVDEFLDNVFKHSKQSFLEGLALFTYEYLKMDKELLVDIRKELHMRMNL